MLGSWTTSRFGTFTISYLVFHRFFFRMNWVDWTWTGCWTKCATYLSITKIFTPISSAQNLELRTHTAQNLAMIFLDPNLALPMAPIHCKACSRRITLTRVSMNPPSTTTPAGQLLLDTITSLLQIFLARVREASHLKFLLQVHQVSPVLSPSRTPLSRAFSQVPEILQHFPAGLTIPVSSLTSQAPCSRLRHHPRPLRATFLACQISLPALKDYLKDPCSCLKDLFLPRPGALGDQLLCLGIQWWICHPRLLHWPHPQSWAWELLSSFPLLILVSKRTFQANWLQFQAPRKILFSSLMKRMKSLESLGAQRSTNRQQGFMTKCKPVFVELPSWRSRNQVQTKVSSRSLLPRSQPVGPRSWGPPQPSSPPCQSPRALWPGPASRHPLLLNNLRLNLLPRKSLLLLQVWTITGGQKWTQGGQ